MIFLQCQIQISSRVELLQRVITVYHNLDLIANILAVLSNLAGNKTLKALRYSLFFLIINKLHAPNTRNNNEINCNCMFIQSLVFFSFPLCHRAPSLFKNY